ncbi:MAG: metal ABC transporter permease [Patescibacteria group bacterium]
MSTNLLSLLTAVFIGGVGGYVGSLMVTKRMALAGDVLSHVALPGVGLAVIYGINISLGALASLVLGVFLVWVLELRTGLPAETLVGIVFILSLAIGFLITPETEILEALFGNISKVYTSDAIAAIVVSVLIFLLIRKIYPKMMLAYVSEDLALVNNVKIQKYNLIYFLAIAAVIAFGIKVAGSLLMSALIIIPAAASRNISRSMLGYSYLAMFIGAASAAMGVLLAEVIGWPVGPVVILVNAVIFGFTLLFKR